MNTKTKVTNVKKIEPPDESMFSSSIEPAGYVAMPKSLTAENGAKTLLSGKFFVQVLETCDDCGGDGWENEEKSELCHSCNGECSWYRKVPIPWTTIKMIYAKAVGHLAT